MDFRRKSQITPSTVSSFTVMGALLLSLVARPVVAEGVFLAGANGDTDGGLYGYVGGIFPLGSSLRNDGFLLRLWGEAQRFDYSTTLAGGAGGIQTDIDADGFGAEAALGYQIFSGSTRLTGYLGAKYRNLDLDPTDPGTDADNHNFGIKGQLELGAELSERWNFGLIGSYVTKIDNYWVRARPGYKLDSGMTAGPEVVVMGGEKWDKQQFGAFVNGINVGQSGNLGLKAGASRDARDDNYDIYVGLSFSQEF